MSTKLGRLEDRLAPAITAIHVAGTLGETVSAIGGSGDDAYSIRLDPGGQTVNFYENNPALSGAPTFSIARSNLGRIIVQAGAGSDLLNIDFSNGNPIAAGGLFYDGGSGAGFDVLQVAGGSAASSTYLATGSADGILTYSGGSIGSAAITFAGLEPVIDTVPATNFTFTAPVGATVIHVVDGPIVSSFQTTQINDGGTGTFEQISFANKTNVTVNGPINPTTLTLDNPTPAAGLARLTGSAGAGSTVNVRTTAAAITTNVVNSGSATVNVSSAGSVQGILGTLNIENPPSFNTIVVDDSADITPRTATLSTFAPNPDDSEGDSSAWGRIQGLAPALIHYELDDTSSVTINAGTGGDRFDIVATGTVTNLNTGGGNDTVAFAEGASLAGGVLDGGAGTDTIDYSAFTTSVHANLGIGITAASSLDGAQETPPNGSTATGTATLTYNASAGTFDINLTVTGITTAQLTAMHLHLSPAGVAGPIIVPFNTATAVPTPTGFTFVAVGVALPGANEAAFLGDDVYINVHTTAFPGGEIRGQVVRQTQTATATTTATGAGSLRNFENVTGGSGNDSIVGSFGVNALLGGPGNDFILGGPGGDTLQGGADDDFLIWANGDGSDLMEGGAGADTVQVNGSVGAAGDSFLVQPNPGAMNRVRFDRVNLGLFNLNIGTTETLTVNGNNGDDTFTVNNLSPTLDLAAVNFNGNADSDTFNVTPSANVNVTVNGGPPTPPALPGDTLNVTTSGSGNPTLAVTSTPTGFQGSYTFGDRNTVAFREIETLSPGGADLSITKTDNQSSAAPGSIVRYTIMVTNIGPLTVTGATVSDFFPAELLNVSYVSGATGGATGNTGAGSGNINDTVSMPVGSTITYSVTGRISTSASGSLTNTATVTAPAGQTDPNVSNNSATDTDTLTALADLGVTKSDSPDPVVSDGNLTYTIVVTNAGPSDAAGVQLSDMLPANTTFVSATQTAGPTFAFTAPPPGGTGNFQATSASLASGASATFVLVVHVNGTTPNGTTLTNIANVSSATADPNSANNAATATTTVVQQADLSVTKGDGADPVVAGKNLAYTITVFNAGPNTAQNVQLSDVLPANTTFVSLDAPPGWTVTTPAVGRTGTVTATRTSLASASAPQVFTILVRVSGNTVRGTTLSNTASIRTDTADPNPGNNNATELTAVNAFPLPVVTGADFGGGPHVKVFDPVTGALQFSFFAYNSNFSGGVRVAAGDVTGDGVPDIITGAGPGGGPHVKVFDGQTGATVRSFFAFGGNFTGGIFVAAGDVNNDGIADLVVGADAGGGPHVQVFSGFNGSLLASFFAYDGGFGGGVRVAAGDVDGDGNADVITAAGAGGGPHVKVFSGANFALLRSFFAYGAGFVGGVYVAAGDLNDDGQADIVTGAGFGGGSHVKAFDGATNALRASFFAFAGFTGGVRVGVADFAGDGQLDIVTGAGPGGSTQVKVFDGSSLATRQSFFAYDPAFLGGVFVG